MSAQHELNNGKPVNPFVVVRAILRSTLRATERLCLLAIADRAGNGRSSCTASYQTLAEMIAMPRRTTIRLTKHLAEKKWITIELTLNPAGDHGPNQICLGPAFFKAIEDQIRLERHTGVVVSTAPLPSVNGATRVVTTAPRGGGDNGAPQTSPLTTTPLTKGEAPAGKSTPFLWDSSQQECIDLATARWGASNGDFIVGDLLRCYTAELVMEAIDRHWAKVGPGLRPALLMATARGMFADGWTPESNGKCAAAAAVNGNGHVAKTYGIRPGP